MGNNPQSIKVSDPQTGQVFAVNIGEIVNDIRKIFLDKRRQQIASVLWKDMTEGQQRDEIGEMTQLTEDMVAAVVDLVASGGKDVIHVKFDQATLKDGDIKVVLKGKADDAALISLNHAGQQTLKIVRIDHAQFDQQRDDIKAEPDQPEMFSEDENQGGQPEEMSDAEIEEIGSEMDDDLDDIEEPDDLHDEEPASDEKVAGYQARKEGIDSQDSPHDIDSAEREEWYLGWKEADDSGNFPDLNQYVSPDEIETEPEVDWGDEVGAEKIDDDESPAEPQSDEQTEKSLMKALSEGQAARLKDAGPDENPYDEPSDLADEWVKGYQAADQDVKGVIQSGRDAKSEGQKKSDCPWKKGSDAERFWIQGFNEKVDESAE